MNNELIKLEALLYMAGNEGASINDVMHYLNINKSEAQKLIGELKQKYVNDGQTIFTISNTDTMYRLATKPELYDQIKPIIANINQQLLTSAALEVVSIVAYKQPVTRIEVDEIRGVNSSSILAKLVDQKIIQIVGLKDTIGKPKLYATTDLFLDYFGIDSLNSLPEIPKVEESSSEELIKEFNDKLNKD